jgi:hypothetical protein
MKPFLSALFFVFILQASFAQSLSVKIVDASTGESIPYANIKVGDSSNLVSNAEGYFTLSENNSADATVLTVSFLGYAPLQATVGELKNQQYVIKLSPGIVELDSVTVTNERPNVDSIMAAVKRNLKLHYKSNKLAFKDQLFMRNTNSFLPGKIKVEITQSTGFTKQQLKATNVDLQAFTAKLMQQPPHEFKDLLCNYYTAIVKKNDKSVYIPRLEVIKATSLKNGDRAISLGDMKQMAENIFLKHLDTKKYYRIKSGLFGSRDTISLKEGFHEKSDKIKPETPLSKSKTDLMTFMYRNNFLQSEKFDFLSKTDWYDYTYEGKIYKSDEEYVYVIRFTPDKGKAKYSGKLYVSVNDYAVVRCDYTLAEGKKVSGFNMKLLLGVKTAENLSKGTIIYKKNPVSEGYYLHYASMETGQYMYVNRPLKFIELSDTEKDVVAFDLKVEGDMRTKTEFLNMNRTETTGTEVEQVKETEFTYTNLKRYDAALWKDYSVIEPLEEMKQLKAEE